MSACRLRGLTPCLALLLAVAPGPLAAASIIQGREAKAGEVPWQVFLDIDFCGGTLLSPSWVLTAKHCMAEDANHKPDPLKPIKIKAGATDKNDPGAVLRTSKRIIDHPTADLKLLELDSPLALGPNIQAVPYTTRADSVAGFTHPGVMGRVSGWGDTTTDAGTQFMPDVLRVVEIPVVTIAAANDPSVCEKYCAERYVMQTEIPAGNGSGKGACNGDSGGPFVVPDGPGGWLLAGVVSRGVGHTPGCGDPFTYTVFVRVSSFAEWIRQNTGIEGGAKPVAVQGPAPGESGFRVEARGGEFYLSLPNPEYLDITLQGVDGRSRSISRHFFPGGRHRLETSPLSPGVYLVRAKASRQTWTRRVVLSG